MAERFPPRTSQSRGHSSQWGGTAGFPPGTGQSRGQSRQWDGMEGLPPPTGQSTGPVYAREWMGPRRMRRAYTATASTTTTDGEFGGSRWVSQLLFSVVQGICS